jgi:hypothetical protein
MDGAESEEQNRWLGKGPTPTSGMPGGSILKSSKLTAQPNHVKTIIGPAQSGLVPGQFYSPSRLNLQMESGTLRRLAGAIR